MSVTIRIAQPRVTLDDPHACTDSSDVLTVFGAVFDALVRRGANGAYEPALATSWTISDDARVFTFKLREGVRFHNGDPCDAEAVRFSLLRMARPDMGATLGAPGVYAQYLAGMTVEIVGPLEIRVIVGKPLADLFDILAYGHILSPRAIAEAGDELAKRAVGTGPYRLESYTPNDRIEARANADHFDGPPTHERIVWSKIGSPRARSEALRDGAVDIANVLEPETATELAATPGCATITVIAPTAMIIMFNAAKGPARDRRVRLALNLAIDREALIEKVLRGAGQPLHGFISPAHFGADRGAPPFQQDKTEARRLLAEAGHADGLTLQVYCPTTLPDEAQALLSALEEQIADLGIRFQIHLEQDRTRYANQVRLKNIRDMCVFDSSPMSAFRVLQEKIDGRVQGAWWEGYHNADVESLIDEARRTVDAARREAIYRACYRLLQQDPPWIYLYNHRRTIGFRGERVGWTMRGDAVLDVRPPPNA